MVLVPRQAALNNLQQMPDSVLAPRMKQWLQSRQANCVPNWIAPKLGTFVQCWFDDLAAFTVNRGSATSPLG
jgi:hypothetical protein